jgi:hypothetical protein
MAWCEPKYKSEHCETAINVLTGGESVAAVCAEIGIARSTFYEWRDKYPEFAKAIQIGLQKAQRDWEILGRQGISGQIDKFSPSPWIFTMKNRFRDDYKDDSKEEKSTETSVLEKILNGEITVNK